MTMAGFYTALITIMTLIAIVVLAVANSAPEVLGFLEQAFLILVGAVVGITIPGQNNKKDN